MVDSNWVLNVTSKVSEHQPDTWRIGEPLPARQSTLSPVQSPEKPLSDVSCNQFPLTPSQGQAWSHRQIAVQSMWEEPQGPKHQTPQLQMEQVSLGCSRPSRRAQETRQAGWLNWQRWMLFPQTQRPSSIVQAPSSPTWVPLEVLESPLQDPRRWHPFTSRSCSRNVKALPTAVSTDEWWLDKPRPGMPREPRSPAQSRFQPPHHQRMKSSENPKLKPQGRRNPEAPPEVDQQIAEGPLAPKRMKRQLQILTAGRRGHYSFEPQRSSSRLQMCMRGHIYILYCLRSSGVHPIINPPLLSAEARDATGPSLCGGHSPWLGHRVSCLGGPELVTPMLLLQLRPSSSSYTEMMGWFHAALTWTYWNEICTILSQLGAAHEVMVDKTKPNSNCWNQWISRDCSLSQCVPTKRLFQVSRHGSSLFFSKVPGNIKRISLRTSDYIRPCWRFQSLILKNFGAEPITEILTGFPTRIT